MPSGPVFEERALSVHSDNTDIILRSARLFAWMDAQLDYIVERTEEDEGIAILPKGRSLLFDRCLQMETRQAASELGARVFTSLN